MSSIPKPTLGSVEAELITSDEKTLGVEHVDNTHGHDEGLSGAQRTLVLAAEQAKAKPLGTFTAIKYYWVAFLWSQYCSFGAILVGYDGTVRLLHCPYQTRTQLRQVARAGNRCRPIRSNLP
jgi:hypothetical protein